MRWKEGSIVLFTALAAHGIMQMGFARIRSRAGPEAHGIRRSNV